MAFQRGETIRCKIVVTNTVTGSNVSPSTSMKITMTNPNGVKVLDNQTMDSDSLGLYHKDHTPPAYADLGLYTIRYIANHGGVITIEDDDFVLEE